MKRRLATIAGLLEIVAGIAGALGGSAQAAAPQVLVPPTTIAGATGPAISGLPIPGGYTVSAANLTPPPIGCEVQPPAQFLSIATTTTASTTTSSTSTTSTSTSTTT